MKEERMLPQPSHAPRDDDRIVLYRGFAYRRFGDGVLAMPSAGRFETLPVAAVPPPVLRALGLAERAGAWVPEAA
jgi:hypothetical protein